MSKFQIILVCGFIAIVLMIGFFIYQNTKNQAAQLEAQKLALLQQSIGGTLGQAQGQGGVGGWITSLLNSSSVTSLASGFGSSYGSSLGQNQGQTKK